MKKTFRSDVHAVRTISDPAAVYGILRGTRRALVTYNQLMKHYEEEGRDIGAVLIAPGDDILFLHLPLFCRHFGIDLYALPAGAEKDLCSIFNMKYVNIVGLYKDDESCRRLKQLGI
ncbi:putative ribosomal protein L7AE [Encephalitozoon cuniculi]|nr:putative ribosomal protein L7AE [Encephalitozoon cuniculi]